jgi:nitrate reductase gamma subunit
VYASLTTGSGNVKASFSLDGQDQSGYSSGPQTASNVQIMTSKSLAAGSHTLKISSQGELPLWIDYLLVQPGTSAGPPPASAKHTNFGAIIGGAVGGAVLLIGAFIIFWMMMKKRRVLKPRHRISNATSTNYLWKQNGTIGTSL